MPDWRWQGRCILYLYVLSTKVGKKIKRKDWFFFLLYETILWSPSSVARTEISLEILFIEMIILSCYYMTLHYNFDKVAFQNDVKENSEAC